MNTTPAIATRIITSVRKMRQANRKEAARVSFLIYKRDSGGIIQQNDAIPTFLAHGARCAVSIWDKVLIKRARVAMNGNEEGVWDMT